MLKNLRINNFRGIKNLKVTDLKDINIFVGDNASGKSSILDALYISINPNNTELPFRTNSFRGMKPVHIVDEDFWRNYFSNFDFSQAIEIKFEGEFKRKINITPKKVSQERITTRKNGKNNKEGISRELKTEASGELRGDKAVGLIISFKIGNKEYHSEIFQDSHGVRMNPDKNYTEVLNGYYLNNYTFIQTDNIARNYGELVRAKKTEQVVEFLSLFDQNIQDVNLDESNRLMIDDRRFSRAIEANTYGDGLLRGLNIITTIMVRDNHNIVLMDEIENGLHPSKQNLIWEFILKAIETQNCQVFAATHSKDMLLHLYEIAKKHHSLNKIKLIRLEKDNDELKAISYSDKEFDYALSTNLEVR